MTVDIIIPIYGRYDFLEKCLESIPKAFSRTLYRVYCYDNATVMDYREKQKFFSGFPVKVTFGKKNIGFPNACNAASRRGKGKYVFLLNSDVILEPESGDVLAGYLSEYEDIGVVGMKLLFPSDVVGEDEKIRPPGKVQHVGISFDINAQPQHLFVGWSPDNPKTMGIIEPSAVTGAALMTRRSLWIKTGGLSKDYGLGTFEDVDFCLQIKRMGKKILVVTEAQGTHYVGASTPKDNPFPLRYNLQVFHQKWAGSSELSWSDGLLL
jgi:O-antigen biosynthesis protein